jgi:hypothetical protein
MPQPKSKAHILKRLQAERRRLEQNLAALSPDDMLRPGVVGEWSVKDVLAHLADWEAHMLVWVEAARSGDPVESPDPGLTWEQLGVFNQRVYEAHRDQPLEDVLEYFHSAHRRFMDMVEAMPEDEMLTPGRYAFTKRGAIYDWLGAYAAHDLWGKTEIRKWMKAHDLG